MPLGILSEYPMFGDSSASQAILFSRPFDSADVVQPSWPNYTLPAAGGDISSAPANNLAFTLMLSATPLTDIPQTSCALKKHSMLFNSTLTKNGDVSLAREESWLQDRRHWRTKWMLEGLQPGTNYTVYVEEAQGRLSGPMFFKTKSGKPPSESFLAIVVVYTPLISTKSDVQLCHGHFASLLPPRELCCANSRSC